MGKRRCGSPTAGCSAMAGLRSTSRAWSSTLTGHWPRFHQGSTMAEKKKVGVLIEGDYYEKEIFYYEHRFPEDGIELHFLSRLWGNNQLTFTGHEWKVPFEVRESFENMSDEELRSYSAIIVPSGI